MLPSTIGLDKLISFEFLFVHNCKEEVWDFSMYKLGGEIKEFGKIYPVVRLGLLCFFPHYLGVFYQNGISDVV